MIYALMATMGLVLHYLPIDQRTRKIELMMLEDAAPKLFIDGLRKGF